MKEILMSIKAEHNHNIEAGLKTAELRLKPPKCELPFKVLTYESGANGRHKVVNEWICDDVTEWRICMGIPAHLPKVACVSEEEIREYSGKDCKDISEMHITNLKVYDKPRELSEFKKPYRWFNNRPVETWCDNYCKICDEKNCKYDTRITRPPQSWCYVEEHGK